MIVEAVDATGGHRTREFDVTAMEKLQASIVKAAENEQRWRTQYPVAQITMYPLRYVRSSPVEDDVMSAIELEWMDGPRKGAPHSLKYETERLLKRLAKLDHTIEPFIFLAVQTDNIWTMDAGKLK